MFHRRHRDIYVYMYICIEIKPLGDMQIVLHPSAGRHRRDPLVARGMLAIEDGHLALEDGRLALQDDPEWERLTDFFSASPPRTHDGGLQRLGEANQSCPFLHVYISHSRL